MEIGGVFVYTVTMEFTEDDITRLAEMGRLELSSEEKATYLKDIKAIVAYVSEISKLSLPENSHNDGTVNVLREDIVIPYAGDTHTLIEQAPSHEDGYVSVPNLFNA